MGHPARSKTSSAMQDPTRWRFLLLVPFLTIHRGSHREMPPAPSTGPQVAGKREWEEAVRIAAMCTLWGLRSIRELSHISS